MGGEELKSISLIEFPSESGNDSSTIPKGSGEDSETRTQFSDEEEWHSDNSLYLNATASSSDETPRLALKLANTSFDSESGANEEIRQLKEQLAKAKETSELHKENHQKSLRAVELLLKHNRKLAEEAASARKLQKACKKKKGVIRFLEELVKQCEQKHVEQRAAAHHEHLEEIEAMRIEADERVTKECARVSSSSSGDAASWPGELELVRRRVAWLDKAIKVFREKESLRGEEGLPGASCLSRRKGKGCW